MADDANYEAAVSDARKRLLSALKAQPMDMMQVGFAAYVNGCLQSARVDALTELYLNPPNATFTLDDALQAAFARAMNRMAEAFEAQAPKIRVASGLPSAIARGN
jgi:hypothetical protein